MEERVTELVHQGLHRLRRLDIRSNRNLLVEEVAVTVLASTLLPDHFVPGRVGLGYEQHGKPSTGRLWKIGYEAAETRGWSGLDAKPSR